MSVRSAAYASKYTRERSVVNAANARAARVIPVLTRAIFTPVDSSRLVLGERTRE